MHSRDQRGVPWSDSPFHEAQLDKSVQRRVVEAVLVGLAYYVAGRLSLYWQLPGTNASSIWPPSGIAMAALLVLGRGVWPGIAIGAFLTNLLTLPSTSTGAGVSVVIAIGNTLEPLLTLAMIGRVSPSLDPFGRARHALWFIGASIIASLLAATIGATTLRLAGIVRPDLFQWAWLTWWVGDAAGLIVLTPALFAWIRGPRVAFSVQRLLELAAVGASTLLIGQLIFGEWAHLPFVGSRPYLFTPVLLWTAFRFGLRETASLALIASAVAISNTWGAMQVVSSGAPIAGSLGPFVNLATSPNEWLVSLQIFVCTSSVIGVVLAAALTERQRSEQALGDSEHRFRTIFEHAAIGVALIDTRTGRYRRVNQRYCDILGRRMEDISATTFQALTHADDLEADLAAQQRLITGDLAQYRREKRYLRGDGTTVWVNLLVSPISESGALPDHHIAVIEDITARKELETRLLEMNATLEARVQERTARLEEVNRRLQDTVQIVNAATDIIYRTDAQGRFTFANQAAERVLKKPLAALLGRHYLSLIRNDAREAAREFYQSQAKQGSFASYYEFPALIDGPDELWLGQNVQLLVEDGRIIGFQGVARDISERKRMERELKEARDQAVDSARLKSEFLANMSHEVRTPMNGVIGLVGLLLDTPLEDEQRRYAEGIRASGESLLTVINDVLDVSKIEAGMLTVERIDFDLPTTLDVILQLFEEPVRRKHLDLSLTLSPDVPLRVHGDAVRLRQILVNLIGNAVKFTEAGEVRLRVTTDSDPCGDVMIRFEVQDTGIGIAPAVIQQLFRPFVQADGSITRQFGGTGLGLVISRRLVELMGGSIGVESTAGAGSTFWFTLPLPKGAPLLIADAKVHIAERRVLVVDGHVASRTVLVQYLKSCGAYALEADDAAHAIGLMRAALVDRKPVEVVVLDHHLPKTDGLGLAQTIKADADLRSARLILVPSSGRRGEGRQAREAGVDAYLPKPVREAELGACITALLADRRTRARAPGATEDALITRHSLAAAAASTARPRILVAEDNLLSQVVARGQLEKLGYAVDMVGDGHAAVGAVKRTSYAAVLMDCQMPGMDGLSATSEIRRHEGDRHTPIIALTAHAMQGERDRCVAAGMDDYLSKPVKLDELSRVLDRFIQEKAPALVATAPVPAASFDVDIDLLGEVLQEVGVEQMASFVESVAADISRVIGKLETPEDPDAMVGVERAAHHLSGGCRSFGLVGIGALASEIETQARDGVKDQWPQYCGRLAQQQQALNEWWRTASTDPRLSSFWPTA